MDTGQQANSGRPGTPMALAPLVYTLWQSFLPFDPDDTAWPNRLERCSNAGQKLQAIDRLGDVVVGAGGEGE
jgi:transketolase